MRRLISVIVLLVISIISLPTKSLAAGISASGGGAKTIGQTFTVNIVASGAEFNAFQGSISVSGPLSVVSVTPGSANWMSQPAANGSFSGALLGQRVSSFTIATLKLKANSEGSGTVNVSNVILKNGASTVGTSGDSANFTIEKAPDLPGAVKVSSSSHPDSNVAYEATTIALNWNKDSGVDGFSYALDQTANTKPEATIKDANTSVTFADKAVGTYYFHIRAHKPDGWGTTTHFKVNIKEPEAKVDEGLSKPHDIKIDKAPTFVDNVRDGTVSGVIISGVTEPEFSVNI
ncbi:MAG: hypothetical protein M1324_00790 [Patescibacteria group bacterium]|nr:hypothetical protein [Patescibacteria group bacterium]